MSIKTLNLNEKLYQYMQAITLREHPVLKALRDETSKLNNYFMQISPEQGQFMALLMHLLNARKTLDIGTFTGYSALAVALALPPEGKVIACDVNEEWTNTAKRFWQQAGVNNKIDLFLAPAGKTLQKFIDAGQSATFDFAFIDADKTNYDDYYEKSLQLIRPGGLIAIDNVFRNGDVADITCTDPQTISIRTLNAKLHNDKRIFLSVIPISDGVTLAYKF